MAVFKEETSLYEILIRVNPDKTWAAQYQTLTEIKKDGVIISATTSDVAPISKDNVEAFEIVQQLLGQMSANTLVENGLLRERIEYLESELESSQTAENN